MRSFLCSVALIFTSACGTTSIGSTSTVTGNGVTIKASSIKCEKFVRYQSNKIVFDAIEIPLGLIGTDAPQIAKMGNVEIAPTKVREVTQKIELLDDRQFSNCQTLARAERPSDEMIERRLVANDDFYKYVLSLMDSQED